MGILEKLNAANGIERQPDDVLVKIILLDMRKIWLWVPKNAGGSISRSLLKVHGETAIACDISLELLWKLNPEFKSFSISAFKRNPYTRIASCWLNKIMAPYEANEPYFSAHPGLRPRMPFAEFAEWLNTDNGSDDRSNRHWMSQHPMLARVDELLPFEQIGEAVRALGIDPRGLPHRNKHVEMAAAAGVERKALLDWYDARAYRAITTRYARDLETLGYSYPGVPPTA